MQPFQCDLPPQLQEPHRTTHTDTTTRCKTLIGGTIRAQNDRSRTRRTDEVPFIAACSHFTRKNTRFRAPASSPQQSPCNIHAAIPMRSAIPQLQEPHRHHFTLPQPLVAKPLSEDHFPSQNDHFRIRHTDEVPSIITCSHSYTEKHKVSCIRLPHFTTKPHATFPCSHSTAICHSSPLPIVTTSLPHHSPSSPLPFVTTSLPHHFPSSPLPIVSHFHRHHHFPSSPLPFITTSLRRHFP